MFPLTTHLQTSLTTSAKAWKSTLLENSKLSKLSRGAQVRPTIPRGQVQQAPKADLSRTSCTAALHTSDRAFRAAQTVPTSSRFLLASSHLDLSSPSVNSLIVVFSLHQFALTRSVYALYIKDNPLYKLHCHTEIPHLCRIES